MSRHERAAVRKRYARILFAGCADVLAAALSVTTARAATTWTIRPGGAVTAKSGTATFKDTKTRQLFTCQSLSARGMLKTGSGLPGSHAGSKVANPGALTPARTGTCQPLPV